MIITDEKPEHRDAVRALHTAAFPTEVEAGLVDDLRAEGDAVISLVALEGDDNNTVVGHILFSKMAAPFRALGLAPVSVAEDHRRKGIAAALIEEGIAQAVAGGWEAIFVLGDPAYYTRFGFNAEAAATFDSPYAGPYLMVLVLAERGLPTATGAVEYAPAFG
ncbi:MAG: N-acetyltransferase, partial [Rhodospirillales bacterium]|nr:N-acetyltransferase [Rhodospirillales bacterium]